MKGAYLWKRILNEGFIGDYIFEDDSNDRIARAVIAAPIVVDTRPLDAVAAWESLSGLAFPFDTFWVEGPVREHQVILPDEKKLLDGSRWGALVETSRKDEVFTTTSTVFFCAGQRRPWLEGAFRFQSERGKPFGTPEAHMNDDVREGRIAMGFSADGGIAGAAAMITDILMFLGCKNISLQPHENEPDQVRRAIKRCGGNEDSYRYHTLVVRPPGARKDSPAQEIGIMPRHVCRGHFAEYGPEFNKGLLFGKYAGRFYVPPCLKGKKENGIVEKDYAIAAGQ